MIDHATSNQPTPTAGPNGEPLYRCSGGHVHAFPLAAEFCAAPTSYLFEVEANAVLLAQGSAASTTEAA